MTEIATRLEKLLDRAADYSSTTIELFKLNAIDKSADVVSTLVTRLTITIAITLFALILSIGMSLWLGELLGKSYHGFFVMAGFFALIAIVLYSFRNQWIKTPVSNSIIIEMQKQK